MSIKNLYKRDVKIGNKIILKILRNFCMDFSATDSSKILRIRRATVNSRYNYFRKVIYEYCISEEKEVFNWVIEMDESYFWPKRVRWKRWRWARWKIKVFGLLKRKWRVYTHIVDDVAADTLLPIIRGKISVESVINTDWWHSYNWLVDLWYKKHYRVNHWENEFVRGKQHINWIEGFQWYCKRRFVKFNWINKEKFALHLKECEFRFNCWLSKEDMYSKCNVRNF